MHKLSTVRPQIERLLRQGVRRYLVNLPIKDIQQSSVEKRLRNEPAVKQEYHRFIKKYEELGHMTPVSNKINEQKNYIFYHIMPCSRKAAQRQRSESSLMVRVKPVMEGHLTTY